MTIDYNANFFHLYYRLLDKAAFISSGDFDDQNQAIYKPWRLCPITQVEEVKCILRLLPIWICTIIYYTVSTHMASLRGARCCHENYRLKLANSTCMSSFNILSLVVVIFLCQRVIDPLVGRIEKSDSKGLTELQRMGIGPVIATMAMVSAGIVGCCRLKYAIKECTGCEGSSSLSIFWQIPQYAFVGASEVFMYV